MIVNKRNKIVLTTHTSCKKQQWKVEQRLQDKTTTTERTKVESREKKFIFKLCVYFAAPECCCVFWTFSFYSLESVCLSFVLWASLLLFSFSLICSYIAFVSSCSLIIVVVAVHFIYFIVGSSCLPIAVDVKSEDQKYSEKNEIKWNMLLG